MSSASGGSSATSSTTGSSLRSFLLASPPTLPVLLVERLGLGARSRYNGLAATPPPACRLRPPRSWKSSRPLLEGAVNLAVKLPLKAAIEVPWESRAPRPKMALVPAKLTVATPAGRGCLAAL